jgi:ketosteroid isomerase-like protein
LLRFIEKIAAGSFFGKVTISFQNGRVCDVKIEQTKKLDELYAANDGAAHAETVRNLSAVLAAYSGRDWSRYRSLLADDLVVVDHRLVSTGTYTGADEFVRINRAVVEVIQDWEMHAARFLAIDETTALALLIGSGTNTEGGAVESHVIGLGRWDGGRLIRWEYFSPDQSSAARERFDDLAGREDVLSNAATAVLSRFVDAFARRDWAGLGDALSDDLVRDDRRRGIGGSSGKEGVMEAWQALAELGYEWLRVDVLAVRGDRLCLSKAISSGPQGFASEALVIAETAEEGRVKAMAYFEANDLDAAFAELDERYLAGEGEGFASELNVFFAVVRAYNRRDWARYRASLHDDFVQVDNRPAGAGHVTGPDDHLTYIRTLLDLAPDARMFITMPIALRPGWALGRQRVAGTTQEGAPFELSSFVLGGIRDGSMVRFEQFVIDEREAAIARFEELSGEQI